MSATDQRDVHTFTFLVGFVDYTAVTGDLKRLVLDLMMSWSREPSLEDLHHKMSVVDEISRP